MMAFLQRIFRRETTRPLPDVAPRRRDDELAERLARDLARLDTSIEALREEAVAMRQARDAT